jgi:glycosyltransferase involved in cell wall biosynthesis
MSCGTPVVTSRMAALHEVVDEAAVQVDAYSVDEIAAGITRVLDDDDLRADLVRKGLARARRFSWERSVRAIHAGYFKALGRPSPVPATAEAAR